MKLHNRLRLPAGYLFFLGSELYWLEITNSYRQQSKAKKLLKEF